MKHFALTALIALVAPLGAWADDTTSYFAFGGNPISARYERGRLVHLPVANFDDDDVEKYKKSEVVAGLFSATRLSTFAPDGGVNAVRIDAIRPLSYGQSMLKFSTNGNERRFVDDLMFVWSGPARFEKIPLQWASLDSKLRESLIAQSRRDIEPALNALSKNEEMPRRLAVSGPIVIRDRGRPRDRPWLVFIGITWHINGIPAKFMDRGLDSWHDSISTEYVYDARRRAFVFRNTTMAQGVDPAYQLLQEPGGPLLVGTRIECFDGQDMLLMDLDHEAYLPEWGKKPPWELGCLPGL